MKLSFALSKEAQWNQDAFYKRPEKRGTCKGFTKGSRRRMMDQLNTVSVAASLPTFSTMTLPDDVFIESPTEFSKRAKVWLDLYFKRLVRVAPDACGFWRIEWQRRKSGEHEGKRVPHFHLMIFGLPKREVPGSFVSEPVEEAYVNQDDPQVSLDFLRCAATERVPLKDVPDHRFELLKKGVHRSTMQAGGELLAFEGSLRYVSRCDNLLAHHVINSAPSSSQDDRRRMMSFADWSSLAWFHVVGSFNSDHLKAGVRCERVRSWGGVMSYTAKYMSKADDDLATVELGRQWGVFKRAKIPWAKMVTVPLDDETGVLFRRIARRYLEKRTHYKRNYPYGITLYANPESFRRCWERPPPDPF